MKAPTVLLFDLDETLLDFERSQRLALKASFRDLGLVCRRGVPQTYSSINGAIWREYERGLITKDVLSVERFRRLADAIGLVGRLAPRLSRAYVRRLAHRADPLPGCRRVLRVAGRRHLLGIVTNGIDRVQRSRLRLSGLDGRFHTVVTSESCGFAKPDPRIVEVALQRMGVGPGEAVFVGDNPGTDGGAAHGAGVRFVWLDRGAHRPPRRRPYRRVTSLRDLAVWIRSL